MLDRLAGDRPVGHLPDGPGDGAASPARRLLQRGLLARIDALNVELPRELGLLLRGDPPYGPPRLRPEPPTVPTRDVAVLDRQAAGAALEVGRPGRGAARRAGGGAGRPAAQRRASASATRSGWPASCT